MLNARRSSHAVAAPMPVPGIVVGIRGGFGLAGLAVLAGLIACSACSGRPTVHGSADAGVVTGYVIKGPLQAGTVNAYQADLSGTRGALLATTTTDVSGRFAMSLPLYAGNVVFAASGGTYAEEAVGVYAKLNGELTALVTGVDTTQAINPVVITPVSHWAATLAVYWTTHGQGTLDAKLAEAYTHLDSDFGALDWQTTVPTDFSSLDGGMPAQVLLDADRAGLLLAGLSQETLAIAKRAAVTPGAGLTSFDLVSALADDLAADGLFDGIGTAGPLRLPTSEKVLPPSAPASATALDGQTLRGAYAQALRDYLNNPIDFSGITFTDAQAFILAISADSDTRLFRAPGSGYDVTPPTLTFNPQPGLYTAQSSSTLYVVADDTQSGVAAVCAQWPGGPMVQGVLVQPDGGLAADAGTGADAGPTAGCVPVVLDAMDGGDGGLLDAGTCIPGALYALPLSFPAPGHYAIAVWGVDNAGNSGASTSSELSATVTFDDSPPVIHLNTGQASYKDESLISVVTSGGQAIVPAQYAFPVGSAAVAVGNTLAVNKASTRLAWGATTPTVAQLRAQDFVTLNVPYLVFDVDYNATVDSPIVGMTYKVTCPAANCGPGFQASAGALMQDPTATNPEFLLPLTSNTIPSLAQVTGSPTSLAVEVVAVDAAGNSGSNGTGVVVNFSVIGPPLVITEDTAYANSGDAKSTYPYLVNFTNAPAEYAQSFNAGNFAPDGNVRLVRYIVQNPHAVPVALSATLAQTSGAYAQVETWNNTIQDFAVTCSGWNCGRANLSQQFTSDPKASMGVIEFPAACAPYYPNVVGGWQYQWRPMCAKNGSWYYQGYVPATCSQPGAIPTTGISATPPAVNASSALTVAAFATPQANGGEVTLAAQVGGDFVVPAAANGPGEVVVYLGRPASVARARPLTRGADAMIDTNVPLPSATKTYNVAIEDFWQALGNSGPCYDSGGNQVGTAVALVGRRHGQYLVSSQTQLAGSATFASQALSSGSTLLGGSQTQSSANFSRTIPQ